MKQADYAIIRYPHTDEALMIWVWNGEVKTLTIVPNFTELDDYVELRDIAKPKVRQ